MRSLRLAAAQLGPIHRSDSRAQVMARLLGLLEQARGAGAELIVFPELAFTTFFPRWHETEPAVVGAWFERELPGPETAVLFERAKAYGIGLSIGYAELTPDGRRFNSSILVDRSGQVVGKYRKVHLPGQAAPQPEHAFQHLEKYYFEPGDLGFPAWRTMGGVMGMMICNDRRWPEAWRVLGLQGVELVMLGFNTPSTNPQRADEAEGQRMFHHKLAVQAGAYQNATWAVAVAKCGAEDGFPMIAGTIIVGPDGQIVAETRTEGDELLVQTIDLDATRFGKTTMFAFEKHRRIEHYGRITAQTGVVLPE